MQPKGNMNQETKQQSGATSPPAPGSAKFTSENGGRIIQWEGNSVTVWRGKVETGIKAIAVEMHHAPSGNITKFIMTENGAAALAILLGEALSPNVPVSGSARVTKKQKYAKK